MFFKGIFEYDLALVTNIVKDKNVNYNKRYEVFQEFCEMYIYFDSLELDKYLLC